MTITEIENLHKAHVEKFTDSKNAFLFDLRRKNNEVIAEKPFQNSGVTGACEAKCQQQPLLGCLE